MRGVSDVSAPEPGFRDELKLKLSVAAARSVFELLHLTYRQRELQPSYHARRAAGESVRCLYASWHCNLWHVSRTLSRQGMNVLVSQHRDGELIARMLAGIGYVPVRGSSTRGGARALRDLTRLARSGKGDLIVTVDGPRGPAQEPKEGILFAASRTGLPIVPVGLAVNRAWRARSWDRTIVGKPWARATVTYGEGLLVPAGVDRDELLGVWKPRLVEALHRAEQAAKAALGGDEQPDGPV
jgi:lysophospholipid acyltransferase (LPLAT)-like uncharacterized protein